MPTLLTFGYEGRDLDDLVDVARDGAVHTVVDVRLNAASRKPGFTRRRLAERLAAAGIDYLHTPALGNPQDNRAAYRAGDATARRRFGNRLRATAARDALTRIRELLEDGPVLLLCYEHDASECHRTAVARALRRRDPAVTVDDR